MTMAERVCKKLGINNDQLDALFTFCPVGCHTSDSVSLEICSRFGLDPDMESWDEELHKREILTDEEFAYIRWEGIK